MIVESLEKREGVGSDENVGGFADTDEQLKIVVVDSVWGRWIFELKAAPSDGTDIAGVDTSLNA